MEDMSKSQKQPIAELAELHRQVIKQKKLNTRRK
jgi:hypothetical protein